GVPVSLEPPGLLWQPAHPRKVGKQAAFPSLQPVFAVPTCVEQRLGAHLSAPPRSVAGKSRRGGSVPNRSPPPPRAGRAMRGDHTRLIPSRLSHARETSHRRGPESVPRSVLGFGVSAFVCGIPRSGPARPCFATNPSRHRGECGGRCRLRRRARLVA